MKGRYRHYKGKEYEVIGIGRDSETLEDVVVYRALYDDARFGNNALWVRPKEEFFGDVEVNGKKKKRFEMV
ncbi:DUF1653 domain-containing protein [Candidatus Woesearchaeota archaeon]|nr:DUF1653 domain-containing protein [Candidatus Woesearchaeota archaeon]